MTGSVADWRRDLVRWCWPWTIDERQNTRPAAVDDAVDALYWLASEPPEFGFIPGSVGIAGDSAGGTTAAPACLRVRDEHRSVPSVQLLIYANTDLTNSGESMIDKGHGFGLDVANIEWFNPQWVPDSELLADPQVSPLFAADLAGLPAAVVVTCEHDPLRDQGEAYAQRLRDAGVAVTARREPGMVHNFLLWDTISPACAAAGDRVGDDLASALETVDSAPRPTNSNGLEAWMRKDERSFGDRVDIGDEEFHSTVLGGVRNRLCTFRIVRDDRCALS
jgi:acetyl esterase/lipase